VVLCTPNNPTGCSLTQEEIARVHDETNAIVLADQAYVEFGGADAMPLLRDRPRLVVLRTFSKAMRMAGLRAGYMLCHPALAAEVNKGKLPYNINFFTEVAAAEVLRSAAELQPGIELLRSERDRMQREAAALPGVRVFPSDANFFTFRIESAGIDHARVFQRLLADHGVLVRDVSGYAMLEGCLRVNAGTPGENDAFLAGLRAILTEGASE
jgi:histidinol-phosphate aminotransferase